MSTGPLGTGPLGTGPLSTKVEVPISSWVSLRLGEKGDAHRAIILSADEDAILLQTEPDLAGVEPPEQVFLEFGYKNAWWSFPARSLAFFNAWWFCERPEAELAKQLQRRAHVRIHFKSTQFVTIPNPRAPRSGIQVEMLNLSANGCLMQSDTFLGNAGEAVLFNLQLPGLPPVPVAGNIVRVTQQETNTYGVYFTRLTQNDKDQLASFIADTIQKNLQQGINVALEPFNYK